MILGQVQQQQTCNACENAVNIREEVAVEPDRLQSHVPFERVPLDVLNLVPCQIQYLQIRQIPQHAARQIAYIVADQPQSRELIEIAERAVVKIADPVLAQVESFQKREIAQRVGHGRKLVTAQIQFLQVGTVAKRERVDARDRVAGQREPIQDEQAVEQLRSHGAKLVVGQLEGVQIVERQKGVALDPIDRVVPKIENLKEEEILEHTSVDVREHVVRQVENDQSY